VLASQYYIIFGLGLIKVLESFSYKDLLKILTKKGPVVDDFLDAYGGKFSCAKRVYLWQQMLN
jgi:hypothetical protein